MSTTEAKAKISGAYSMIREAGKMLEEADEAIRRENRQRTGGNLFRLPLDTLHQLIQGDFAEAIFGIKAGNELDTNDRFSAIAIPHRDFGEATFDVIGVDADDVLEENAKHRLTLALRDVFPGRYAFDEPRDGWPWGRGKWDESTIRAYLQDEEKGFLSGFPAAFRDMICTTKRITALSEGGQVETEERAFLLSLTEVFGNPTNGVEEGRQYKFFKIPENRVKFRDGDAAYWWLRSPDAGHGRNARSVITAGQVNVNSAHYADGLAPACIIA